MNKPLKYLGYSIVFAEVPDEISLAIDISGCPHKCEGCHSSYLWEYKGNLLKDDLPTLISENEGISCVCFMGGEQNTTELIEAIKYVKSVGLKTCLYSGEDDINILKPLIHELDYLKYGRYNNKLGGLDCKTTNQKMIDLNRGKEIVFYENRSKQR